MNQSETDRSHKNRPLIQIISDVHLDLNKIDDFASILTPAADYLAILGDVGFRNMKHSLDFMSYCSTHFKQVFLVLGNHDYYSDEHPMQTVYDRIKDALRVFENVHLLERSVYDLSENEKNIRILGTTLWSFVKSSRAESYLNDYRYVRMPNGGGRITIDYLNSVYFQNASWLEYELKSARADHKQVIVLTHHMPSFELVSEKYCGYGDLNTAFASHLDHLCKYADYWLFGHTHDSVYKKIGECVCVSNPYGYDHENGAFNRKYVI